MPIYDFWKKFQMCLSQEFNVKKGKPSRAHCQNFKALKIHAPEQNSIFCISAFEKAVLTIYW